MKEVIFYESFLSQRFTMISSKGQEYVNDVVSKTFALIFPVRHKLLHKLYQVFVNKMTVHSNSGCQGIIINNNNNNNLKWNVLKQTEALPFIIIWSQHTVTFIFANLTHISGLL